MNDQWQFSLVHLAVTLWALRPSHILIGIEKEAVLRGLFAKLYCGFLFSIWHGLLLFLDKDNGLLDLAVLTWLLYPDHRARVENSRRELQYLATALFCLTLLSMHVNSYCCFADSSHTHPTGADALAFGRAV